MDIRVQLNHDKDTKNEGKVHNENQIKWCLRNREKCRAKGMIVVRKCNWILLKYCIAHRKDAITLVRSWQWQALQHNPGLLTQTNSAHVFSVQRKFRFILSKIVTHQVCYSSLEGEFRGTLLQNPGFDLHLGDARQSCQKNQFDMSQVLTCKISSTVCVTQAPIAARSPYRWHGIWAPRQSSPGGKMWNSWPIAA